VTWEWYLNDVLLRDTTSYLPTFNQGLFRVEAFVGACRNAEEVDLLRAPINPSYIEPEYVICPEPPTSEVAIIEPGDFVSYLAYNMESGDQIFETSPGIFEIIEEGYYTFEMENEFRCITYDTTFVDVDCLPTIYAPNAFSPYASIAENQTFRLFPSFVEDFEIFIYNRWGELVFHSDDLDFMTNTGWDGTKNGKILPLGTYAYIIRFTSLTEPERGTIEQGGGVVLLR
jgi:gliding motility-associated-like protein